MKLTLVFLAVVAAVYAAPPPNADAEAVIVRSTFDSQPEGGYNFDFENSNGISRQESGEVKQVVDEENKPHDVVVVRGQYSYTDPEGNVQTITFVADQDGFKPEGDSIPKPPSPSRR